MEKNTLLGLIAALLIVLLPLVPSMVRLRIRVLHWMGLESLAKFHERGFGTIVTAVRVVLVCLILALLVVVTVG